VAAKAVHHSDLNAGHLKSVQALQEFTMYHVAVFAFKLFNAYEKHI